MVPAAQSLEDRVAVKPRRKVAGQAPGGPEKRGAGKICTWAALVAVRIADHSDTVILLECIPQDPLERAPGGMHLHRSFKPPVMGLLDIGIAAANVRQDDAVLSRQLFEKLMGIVRVVGFIGYFGRIRELSVR